MKITIKDIAKHAGVSATTVSKIINNKDQDISDATREKVLQIMKEYNYVPNTVARSLVTKKTRTIGLVIPDIRNPFFPELARGAEDKANEEGYNIIFCNTDDDISKEEKYIAMLVEKMVDGIIFTASSKRTSDFKILNQKSIPIVLVDRNGDFQGVKGKVIVDNFKGAYEGATHLLECGYKNIVFISGPLSSNTSIDRLKGYRKALESFGIEYKEDNVLEGDYKSQWGYEAVRKLLNKDVKFDGIFCGNDMIAIGAIKSLKEENIKVPKEVGVVGFDDIYMARIVEPEITSVKQPNYEMGYKAAEMLINIINNEDYTPEDIVLPTKLVTRNSTAQK